MRLLFLGHHDIASLTAINRIILSLPEHDHAVLLSTADGDSNPLLRELADADAALSARFLGGDFAQTPHDAMINRSQEGFERPNASEGLASLRDLAPDLIISIRYRRILHEDAIAIPPLGVINLHSGILPDYRGVMATFWAMLDGRAEIGTTLHRITDRGIDTGTVIDINRQPAAYDRSYLSNVLSLYPAGCRSVVLAVQKLSAGEALEERRQPAAGRYFSAPDENSVRRFEARGLRLVDGDESEDITQAPDQAG